MAARDPRPLRRLPAAAPRRRHAPARPRLRRRRADGRPRRDRRPGDRGRRRRRRSTREATAHAASHGLDHVAFAVADATRLPFADDTFDAVLAHSVLEAGPDPAEVLAEAWRVLRPGGWLGVGVRRVRRPGPGRSRRRAAAAVQRHPRAALAARRRRPVPGSRAEAAGPRGRLRRRRGAPRSPSATGLLTWCSAFAGRPRRRERGRRLGRRSRRGRARHRRRDGRDGACLDGVGRVAGGVRRVHLVPGRCPQARGRRGRTRDDDHTRASCTPPRARRSGGSVVRWPRSVPTTWPRPRSRGCSAKAPGLDPERIGDVVWGNANGAGEDNRNVGPDGRAAGRAADLGAGGDGEPVVRVVAGRGDGRLADHRVRRRRHRADRWRGVDDPGAVGAAQAVAGVPRGQRDGGVDDAGVAAGQRADAGGVDGLAGGGQRAAGRPVRDLAGAAGRVRRPLPQPRRRGVGGRLLRRPRGPGRGRRPDPRRGHPARVHRREAGRPQAVVPHARAGRHHHPRQRLAPERRRLGGAARLGVRPRGDRGRPGRPGRRAAARSRWCRRTSASPRSRR